MNSMALFFQTVKGRSVLCSTHSESMQHEWWALQPYRPITEQHQDQVRTAILAIQDADTCLLCPGGASQAMRHNRTAIMALQGIIQGGVA